MKATIVLLPGDGIGPEVVREARAVLEVVATRYGHTFEFVEHLIGNAQILGLQPSCRIQQQDHHLGHVDRPTRVGGGQFLQLVFNLGPFAQSRRIDKPHRLAFPLPVQADAVAGDAGFGTGDHPLFAEHLVD